LTLKKNLLRKGFNVSIGRINKKIKIISRRGNMNGPCRQDEPSPKRILEALRQGFDVEADAWRTERGWFFGHDFPRHPVSHGFNGLKPIGVSMFGVGVHSAKRAPPVFVSEPKSFRRPQNCVAHLRV
jgi:hypothetical protein